MSVRNFEEYRAEVLEQLGATAEDIRNEASWRAKVLETLGAEYTDEDTRNFERYRLKVLENLSGGGGGETWNTVFEGSVTTEESGDVFAGYINTDITADTIKVTFNGVEYTCNKIDRGDDNIYYGALRVVDDGVDFSEYPFGLCCFPGDGTDLYTQTAGTYTLKIEEPQGGGSSDFSTATLSIVDDSGYNINLDLASLNERGFSNGGYLQWNSTDDLTVILYKGSALLELENLDSANISVSGAIENVAINKYNITGDCTITIS